MGGGGGGGVTDFVSEKMAMENAFISINRSSKEDVSSSAHPSKIIKING